MSINLSEVFLKFEDEYHKFDLIENKPSKRPDLCAFLLLDKIIPGNSDIVGAAEHDEIYLGVDCEVLSEIATEDDILYLVRCGVIYNEEYDSLSMFA